MENRSRSLARPRPRRVLLMREGGTTRDGERRHDASLFVCGRVSSQQGERNAQKKVRDHSKGYQPLQSMAFSLEAGNGKNAGKDFPQGRRPNVIQCVDCSGSRDFECVARR